MAKQAVVPQKQHAYRKVPLLAKPGKRTRQEALRSALHMGVCVGLSLLVFAVINICVTQTLNPKDPFVKFVQSGTMVSTHADTAHTATLCCACDSAC
jgi:hypothetical protein